MRRRIILLPAVFMLLLIFARTVIADPDIEQYRDCKHCGMDRKAYGYSRMLIVYKDGKQVGTCSLNCVVTEMNNNKSGETANFMVADRITQKLIDAEKAVWVIGGKKRGVMTLRAKWAFADKAGALKFVASYGGTIAIWSEALAAAREDTTVKIR